MSSVDEVSIGAIDHDKVTETLKALPKKRKCTQFSDRDRLLVGRHASVFRNASAVRKFYVSESTVKLFCIKYESSLTNVHSTEEVTEIPKAWPLMTGKLLEKQVQEYLYIYRKKGCIVNKVLAVATAKALIERSNLKHSKDLDLENSSRAKSLFNRMGFVKRAATTGRPDIPEGAKKEAEILLLHQIVGLD